MIPFTRLPSRPAALLAALALALAARADDDATTVRARFSDPAKPGTLKLASPWAEIHVTGTDGPEIVVSSSLESKEQAKEPDADGFRRLDSDVSFELVEKDNVAVITVAGDNTWATQGAEFTIQVPRNTNLVLRSELGGEISVEGVEGDVDINSLNGEVTLRDLGSSAVVNTMNGEIHASFGKAPTKPVSLSTMNGEIDLSLPAATKANLRMRTHNGSVRTNFAAGALQTKTEKVAGPLAGLHPDSREYQRELARQDREQARLAREQARLATLATPVAAPEPAEAPSAPGAVAPAAPVPPMPPIPPLPAFGGKSIVGTLNGGGVDIKLTSMNGAITLRESK